MGAHAAPGAACTAAASRARPAHATRRHHRARPGWRRWRRKLREIARVIESSGDENCCSPFSVGGLVMGGQNAQGELLVIAFGWGGVGHEGPGGCSFASFAKRGKSCRPLLGLTGGDARPYIGGGSDCVIQSLFSRAWALPIKAPTSEALDKTTRTPAAAASFSTMLSV